MDLNGKVALVTGGASGIGLSAAKCLLEEGVSVVLFDIKEDKGEESKELLEAQYGAGKVHFICGNVTKKEELEGVVKETIDKFSRLDIMINNAGIQSPQWEDVIDVNLKAVVRGTDEAMKYMSKENGGIGGVVLNTASIAGLMPIPQAAVYAASKSGIIGYTRSRGNHEDYERTGVRVLAVCPGFTESGQLQVKTEEDLQNIRDTFRMATIVIQPAEVVGAAMVEMVKSASNGSLWVVENGGPAYQISIPEHKLMKVNTE